MVDLDELERILAAATPGEWSATVEDDGDNLSMRGPKDECIIGGCGCCESPFMDNADDAASIVALHNSAAAMIAEIRELRAENARLRVECEFIASATASPLVNSLETGFRHSPLSPSERETRYMEACALAHQSACVALTGEPS